jgi:integrase
MSSFYRRGKSLWIAFKNEHGKRVCRPSGYKVGQEEAVRALLVELDRRAAEAPAAPAIPAAPPVAPPAASVVPGAAPAVQAAAPPGQPGSAERRTLTALLRSSVGQSRDPDAPRQAPPMASPTPTVAAIERPAAPLALVGPTVREYGEEWLQTREHIETVADEAGRLRNHVFPRIGDLPMRAVRPRHIRDLILDLKKSNVRKRGRGQGMGTKKIAPRTVRHTYSLLRRMFSAAVIDEVIEASPVIVAKGVLPKNVDKDPAWRATALYERDELVRLVSDPVIPPERRILNAIKGLAGTRHGEAAGLRWSNRIADAKPLGKLVIARSYDKDGTKTRVSRLVPIHPVLAQLLNAWERSGWAAVYGRPPTPNDYIVPRSVGHRPPGDGEDGDLWPADQAFKLFTADLEALGMRLRRGHDLRRTFITLAQEDGARRDVLKVITHAPDAADVMSLYTTYPWPTLCAEVAKLQIALPEPRAPRVVANRPVPDAGRAADAASPQIASEPRASRVIASRPGSDTERTPPAAPPQSTLLSLLSTAPANRQQQHRPMEPRDAAAPARAAAPGAARSLGEVAVATPPATVATCSAPCSSEISNDLEPLARFERATYGLRNRCSTPELQRQGRG